MLYPGGTIGLSVMRPREDRLSVARRHVAEAERHVADQMRILYELERDGHWQLAAQARALLTTLENSLRLAREDVARIEKQG